MSKRLLITVADSTKVVTIDGSVDANILKEVICGILCLFIWFVILGPSVTLHSEEAHSAVRFLIAVVVWLLAGTLRFPGYSTDFLLC